MTEEERFERFDLCEDLVENLVPHCMRHRPSYPDDASLLQRVRFGVNQKGWDITPAELNWVIQQVVERLPPIPGRPVGQTRLDQPEPVSPVTARANSGMAKRFAQFTEEPAPLSVADESRERVRASMAALRTKQSE